MSCLVSGRIRPDSRSLVLPNPQVCPLTPWDWERLGHVLELRDNLLTVRRGETESEEGPGAVQSSRKCTSFVSSASNRCIMETGIATGHLTVSFLEVVTNSSSHYVAYRGGWDNANVTFRFHFFSLPSSGGKARAQWFPEVKCARNL